MRGGGQERRRKEDIYTGSSQATIWDTVAHWDVTCPEDSVITLLCHILRKGCACLEGAEQVPMAGVVSDPCFRTPGNWSVFLLPVYGVLDQTRVRP